MSEIRINSEIVRGSNQGNNQESNQECNQAINQGSEPKTRVTLKTCVNSD